MDRRKFLAAMAAGAVITAEGLWIPESKLISIPSKSDPYMEYLGYGWYRCNLNEEHQAHGHFSICVKSGGMHFFGHKGRVFDLDKGISYMRANTPS